MIPSASAHGAAAAAGDSEYVPLKVTSTATVDDGGVNEYGRVKFKKAFVIHGLTNTM